MFKAQAGSLHGTLERSGDCELITKPEQTTGKDHYYELDSLRGLAALTVMIHHLLLVFPVFSLSITSAMPFGVYLVQFTPLGVVMAGRAAVIFFFVLSGFVLALPFLKSDAVISYRAFAIKRFFRIYPPYFFALVFAVMMNFYCCRESTPDLSGWFKHFWEPRI